MMNRGLASARKSSSVIPRSPGRTEHLLGAGGEEPFGADGRRTGYRAPRRIRAHRHSLRRPRERSREALKVVHRAALWSRSHCERCPRLVPHMSA